MWTRAFLLSGVLLSALATALTPPALAAQSVYHTVAGVRRVAPERVEPSVLLIQQESESSLGAHIAIGALAGVALGAAVGMAAADCSGFMSELCRGDAALTGALIGGVVGAFVGIFVWQGTKPPPAPTGDIP
jgi:hypothetical protein